MRKAKITAAIITKNEEKNIAACIASVKGWADQILVVDGFSADRTVEIAEAEGAEVIQHKFEGSFAVERNIGMKRSVCDWVLHLDADDRVTEDFRNKVDEMIDASDGIDVYYFRRKSYFLGHFMEHGGWYHSIPNLTRKGVVFKGELHERPEYSGKSAEINADIEHHPFDSISQFMERHNRYSTIESKRIFDESGTEKLSELRKNMVGRTFKIFWKIYVKKKGHKEGRHGLVFAALFAFMNFLVWAKYWELCQIKSGEGK